MLLEAILSVRLISLFSVFPYLWLSPGVKYCCNKDFRVCNNKIHIIRESFYDSFTSFVKGNWKQLRVKFYPFKDAVNFFNKTSSKPFTFTIVIFYRLFNVTFSERCYYNFESHFKVLFSNTPSSCLHALQVSSLACT